MLKSFFFRNWTPEAMRRGHPLVQHHLRHLPRHLNPLVLGSSVGLFLLFGGLSLPMMYFLLSLFILLQTSTGTAGRIYQAQTAHTWDLIRLTPFSNQDILLSAWSAGVWQLRRTWAMPLYRLLHGLVVVGALVFGLWFGEIPARHASLALIGATLLITAQPFIDLYFSGMVGLLCASLIRERLLALAAAGGLVLCYWLTWIGMVLLALAADLNQVQAGWLALAFVLLLALPLLLGFAMQRTAEVRFG